MPGREIEDRKKERERGREGERERESGRERERVTMHFSLHEKTRHYTADCG
jgi:hypothetical protein